ncbi:PREDICTED: modifier of mdg4 isoform X1 [Rhagoletis zephyria]|uniref:modifier of mdg4 isoform X1 n=1 Tax=Rhagoletis zephyria TaxID=28612 RepID=UPI00081164FF|nr:PREDICTED: modifier of mdg4 isoform X1 [Rhagoletis zephyria]
MADDEQFSLCWNNFNSNLSAGFHESLCRGDLVDVTLAAEGQFVKAHRLVLSVCSPYFRKMFTQMPANQHAFVFLKDVSHTALKDLIQFMYCGEVNVKQEALPAFISTAEALQIKGLTDSDPPPSQSPAEPSTPTPQIQQISSPRVRQRTSATRSFKIESVEDSGDDKQTQIVIQTTSAPPAQQVVTQPQTQHLQQTQSQTHIAPQQIASTTTAATTTVVTHKRPARSIGSGPHIKRTKSTIDPLDTSDPSTGAQQITVQTAVVAAPAPEPKAQVQQQQPEPEYIDLPIELPTKSEPDYAEEAGDVEGGENETTYVEDDSYGELRYDESYFTENDEAPTGATTGQSSNVSGGGANATTSKALVKQQQSSFSDNSYVDVADQANSDAQVKETLTLPKILDGKFYRDVQPNLKTVGGIQATCTTCLGTISGTTKSTGNFLSHIKRRHKDIIATCQMYCRTKVQNLNAVLSNTYNDDSDNIKKEKSMKELKQEPLNVAIYTATGILPQHQIQGQHGIATPAFIWHKSLPLAPTNSMAVAATMQYRKFNTDMQPTFKNREN